MADCFAGRTVFLRRTTEVIRVRWVRRFAKFVRMGRSMVLEDEFVGPPPIGVTAYGVCLLRNRRGTRERVPHAVRCVAHLVARCWLLVAFCLQLVFAAVASAFDTSPPPILQYFESSYNTISSRMPDIFQAGYGTIYTPPPGRADSGNSSVGYDPYDHFDLGSPGNPTLYGTQTGLQTLVNNTHTAGMSLDVDLVLGHDGFSDLGSVDGNGNSFYNAGGYPGMNISLPNAVDGDFYDPFETDPTKARLSGLIEIDPTTNFQMIRSPVNPNDPRNIRPGTTPAFGRIANLPQASNCAVLPRYEPHADRRSDPTLGQQNVAIYPFNLQNPMNGTPEPENVVGYLMRNTQWLVQVIGVDGFRIDAAKNMQQFVLNYYDESVYRASNRYLLNGQQEQISAFSEVFDGSIPYLDSFVNKTINPNTPNVVGGNRDVLNFPAFFAMQTDLSGNGLQNSWQDLLSQDQLDQSDDGLLNGSVGVRFVSSQDNGPPFLGNVAYAYSLMLPGNAIVYFNAHQFGSEAQRNFPRRWPRRRSRRHVRQCDHDIGSNPRCLRAGKLPPARLGKGKLRLRATGSFDHVALQSSRRGLRQPHFSYGLCAGNVS